MRLVSTPSPGDIATDGELDPTSLRIVRLRLALALIAAAILPLAVGAPVLRVLLDDTQAAATDRLADDAAEVATAMTVELEGTRRALGLIAAHDAAPAAAAGDEHARDELARAVDRLREGSAFVHHVWTITSDGATAVDLDPEPAATPAPALSAAELARALALQPGQVRVVDPGPRGADLLLLTAIPGEGKAAGLLAASLNLERLVRLAAAEAGNGEWSVAIRPAGGEPISVVERPGMDVASLPGEVLGRALDPAEGLEAAAEDALDALGFAGWTVVLHAPFAVSSVPLAPLGLLALICLALVGLIGWMAGQVLRPAAELDASRRRLRELYSMEREASLRDHLTGLGNHRAFQEELARQFDQTGRYHVPMSVVLLDLDEFKQVNDTLGHAVGDDLLAEVGRVIRGTIRAADRAFRTGGDEFAIVLPHTDASGGMDLANRLLRRLLDDRPSGRYQRPISCSGGVAAAPEHAGDRLQLLARADAALYRSKRNGRTMITLFDAEIDRPALSEQERATLSARVTRVASSRSLTAVYQPIVHLESGRPIAYEGLIRPAPDSGFESPAALFAAAEVSGRIIDLDRACLDVVVAGARQAPDDVYLSLNVSPRTFEAPEFSANAFLSILHRHGVPPRRVILELTERETIEDVDRLRVALESCRRAGVQIAADDVGAGNAGIRMLSQIQFDVIKIDLSLVQAAAGREPVGSVLSSIVDLARRWRALVVAEGVETPEQLRMIKALGIDAAQGYLLGRPGPLVPSITFDLEALATEPPQAWWLAARAASTPLAS
ncbi:MAG TPA: bifunctional diguanylate cyclase/phosphodiesterase [Candidatus Limnocylindrales bacterium]|nr:bifunctional diguanylate cyclase/phosphodiesterase [Candidatus Limnocylindrales bacterium]